MKLKAAEEVAREMITAPVMEHGWVRVRLEDHEDYVPLEAQESEDQAQYIANDTIGILARLIERSRAEGAEAERERIYGVMMNCEFVDAAPPGETPGTGGT